VTLSSITVCVAPLDQVTRIDAGASTFMTPVITKCHSLELQSWSLSAFARISTMAPPPVVLVDVDVPVDVPVEVPVDVLVDVPPLVEVEVDVPVDVVVFVPVDVDVLVFVPVDVLVDVPVEVLVDVPVDVEVDVPPVVVPCSSHSTLKTLCFSVPGGMGDEV
jgi:hypothetical protein